MNERTFGEYLREIRKTHIPPMTQERLASAIGRSKMTISQFESGKNAPPQGELLDRIVEVLCPTSEQECELRFLACATRKTLPSDIERYFFENPSICKAIRKAKESDADDSFWSNLSAQIERNHE